MKPVQLFVALVLFTGTTLTLCFVFPAGITMYIAFGICMLLWLYIAIAKQIKGKLLWISAGAIMLCNIFITHHFYYWLLKCQVGNTVGKYLHQHHISTDQLLVYRLNDPIDALPFYAQGLITNSDKPLLQFPAAKYVLTSDSGSYELKDRGFLFDTVKHGKFFKVSELTPEFLNPAKRDSTTKDYYLLKMR